MFKKILTGVLAAAMVLTSGIFAVSAETTLIDAISADNADGTYSVTEQNVRFLGRTYEKDGGRWFNWNNSGFEFTFYGTKAEVEIYMVYKVNIDTSVEPNVRTEEPMGGHLNVYVDGAILPEEANIIPITSGTNWVTLVDGLEEGYHTITVRTPTWTNEYWILFTSPINGNIRCAKRIRTDGTLCLPPEQKALSFEAIGDSITNGDSTWNIDGAPVSWSTWAAYTARYFDADLSTLGISGNGVISWVMGGGGMYNLTDCYPYTWRNGCVDSSGKNIEWDASKDQIDVVMINLGTNDRSNIDNPEYDTTSEKFVAKYVEMMKLAKQKNPDAIFLCMLGAMGHQGSYVDIQDLVIESVNTFNTDMGEEIAWYIELPKCDLIDFDGDGELDDNGDGRPDGAGYDGGHPSIEAHKYYSEMLIEFLEPKLEAMGKWNSLATSILGAQTRPGKYVDASTSPTVDMRFVATVDTALLKGNIDSVVDMGMVFAKKSDIEAAGCNNYDINLDTTAFTVKKAEINYLYNGYENAATPRYRFYATITNINNIQKYQTEYVARSYVTVLNDDGTYSTRYSRPVGRKSGVPIGNEDFENSVEMW